MSIGEILREYRKEHGLSQRQFAEQCGDITNGYISMLEQGRNPTTGKPIIPSIDKLAALARGMNMTLHELVAMADDMPVFVGDAEKWDAEIEKTDHDLDPDKWIALAPGFYDMPEKMQRSFRVALTSLWQSYHDLNQQRKDDEQ